MRTPQQFYRELGARGLALRKKPENTKSELNFLKKILDKKQKILDLACGYGRFTIPLAKEGYDIQGLDLSPDLLKKAREDAKN
jgi:2-polyprenyl-3-methyl-5-hydroxy-6-metoxy-1,4-benzoquinol methylase